MRNVRIRVAYDGSGFFGWQRQDGFDSVQQAIEEALAVLVGERVVVHGAGRTDTGVHAAGQVAHFHVDTRLDDATLLRALNANLPRTVVVDALETCRDDFHARFDARSKRYAYVIATTRFPPPGCRTRCHWTPHVLDVAPMRRAALQLLGRHDFRAFSATGSPRKTTVRHVKSLHFLVRRRTLCFVVEADGFLYNMVRTIAGTLIDVGRGKLDPDAVSRAIGSGDRDEAGPTAPPGGLYLRSVQYDEPVFRDAPRRS